MTWKVLVADDDPTVPLLAAAALAASDFVPSFADDGDAAVEIFGSERFDIALIDVEMPGLDGFEVCAAIRRARGEAFPLLLVSGRGDAEFLRRAAELSAATVAKPLDWGALPDLLRERLGAG